MVVELPTNDVTVSLSMLCITTLCPMVELAPCENVRVTQLVPIRSAIKVKGSDILEMLSPAIFFQC